MKTASPIRKWTDIEFDDFRQARDDLGRGKIEPVTRVTFEPLAAREHSRCLDADEFRAARSLW